MNTLLHQLIYYPLCRRFGALTSKPYAFRGRPWELVPVESTDFVEPTGSPIRLDLRSGRVVRILPQEGGWISDRLRFGCDGFYNRRIDRPRFRGAGVGLEVVGRALRRLSAVPSTLRVGEVDYEAGSVLNRLIGRPGTRLAVERNLPPSDRRGGFLLPPLEQLDQLLLVGSAVRLELPLFALRLRQERRRRGLGLFLLGSSSVGAEGEVDLGSSPSALRRMVEGRHPLCRRLTERTGFLLGSGSRRRADQRSLFRLVELLGGLSCGRWGSLLPTYSSIIKGELGLGGSNSTPPLPTEGEIQLLLNPTPSTLVGSGPALALSSHPVEGAEFLLPGTLPFETRTTLIQNSGVGSELRPATTPPGEGVRRGWRAIQYGFRLPEPEFDPPPPPHRWEVPSSPIRIGRVALRIGFRPPHPNPYRTGLVDINSAALAVGSERLFPPFNNF